MALARSMGWVAADPVAGQLADPDPGAIPAEVLQGLGHLPVRPGPAGGTQVFVQGVLDEGVGEGVAPGGVGQLAHQGHGGRGVEDVEQLVLGGLGRPGQEIEIEVPTDDRRQRQHPPGVLAQSHHPGPDHLAHAVGQGHRVQGVLRRPPSRRRPDRWRRSRQMAQHLAHEEGVAVGLSIDGVGETHAGIVKRRARPAPPSAPPPRCRRARPARCGRRPLSAQGRQGVQQGIGVESSLSR